VAGHPVVFAAHLRSQIAGLPDGDTLRRLRDDPRWRRVTVNVAGDAPYLDVDTPDDYRRLAGGG
jgi:CTP:molybdopterin cytidylyltransferase MocA